MGIMDFINRIINDWDPVDLLSHAPEDEYHSEIDEIRNLLYTTDHPLELAEGISKIFVESFGNEVFKKSKDDCLKIVQTLLCNKVVRHVEQVTEICPETEQSGDL